MKENKISIYAYVISFLYVGFGTFTILCLRPDAPFTGDWAIGGLHTIFNNHIEIVVDDNNENINL